MGATTSPLIFTVFFIYPNKERDCAGIGTSCATGLPCLVITTGCPVRATSSINFRHSALKTAAGISIRFSHMTTIYGHYIPLGLGATLLQPAHFMAKSGPMVTPRPERHISLRRGAGLSKFLKNKTHKPIPATTNQEAGSSLTVTSTLLPNTFLACD